MSPIVVLGIVGAVVAVVVLYCFLPEAHRAWRSWNLYRRGLGEYKRGDTDAAEVLWREAVAASAANVSARLGLGKLLVSRGDAPGALEQYRQALAVKPGYGKARINMANVLLSQNAADEALEQYELAVGAGIKRAHKMIGMIQQHHRKDRAKALAAYSRYMYEVGPDAEIEAWIRELTGKDG
jgi:tetratricopeptide (TPR) repeat protein